MGGLSVHLSVCFCACMRVTCVHADSVLPALLEVEALDGDGLAAVGRPVDHGPAAPLAQDVLLLLAALQLLLLQEQPAAKHTGRRTSVYARRAVVVTSGAFL